MRRIFSLLLALAILTGVAVDGRELIVAYQNVRDVAESAAQEAARQYVVSGGNQLSAELAARRYASSTGAEIVDLTYGGTNIKWFEVRAREQAKTRVLHYIPGVNRLLAPESTATAQI